MANGPLFDVEDTPLQMGSEEARKKTGATTTLTPTEPIVPTEQPKEIIAQTETIAPPEPVIPDVFGTIGKGIEDLTAPIKQAGQAVKDISAGKVPTKAPAPVPTEKAKEVKPVEEKAFLIKDPITGEELSFDTQEKADKERVKLASKAEELKLEKERLGKTDDIIDNLLSFIKDVTDPTTPDPIRTAEFNYQLNTMGVTNQAASDAMLLKLKQQGIEGQGSGNALLLSLARSQGKDFSDVVLSLNVDSARRIEEWNRIGPQKAFEALKANLGYKVSKHNFGVSQIQTSIDLGIEDPNIYSRIAASNGVELTPEAAANISKLVGLGTENALIAAGREILGNYDQLENDLEGMVPGLNVYGSAFAGLDQGQQADVSDRIEQIGRLLEQNRVEDARNLLIETQTLYPNTIKGDYTEWDPRDFRTLEGIGTSNAVKVEISNLVTQGDFSGAMELWKDSELNPLTINEDYTRLIETSSPDRIDRILERAGLTEIPITEDEMGDFLAADAVMGISPSPNEKVFDAIYTDAGPELREFLMTPDGADATRNWIFNVGIGNFEFDADGNLVPDQDRLLPPWDPNSIDSHYFSDWPLATSINEETGELDITYDGYEPLAGDNDMQSDGGYITYTEEINKAWEAYTNGTTNPVSRRQWFEDVKPVWDGKSLTFNGEAVDRPTSGGDTEGDEDIINNIFLSEIAILNDTEFNNKLINEKSFREGLFKVGTQFSSVGSLQNLTVESVQDDIIDGPTKGFAKIGDSFVRFRVIEQSAAGGNVGQIITSPLSGAPFSVSKNVVIDIIDLETGEVTSTQKLGLDGDLSGKVTQEDGETITIEEFLARQKDEGTNVS